MRPRRGCTHATDVPGEPVAGALAVPGTQRFVLVRDTGGDEWFQLYATGLTAIRCVSPRRVRAIRWVLFSPDGKLLAWSRATKGSADYSIFIADPPTRAARGVYREAGSVGPDGHFSRSRPRLLFMPGSFESRVATDGARSCVGQGNADRSAGRQGSVQERALLRSAATGCPCSTDQDSDFGVLLEIEVRERQGTVRGAGLKWDIRIVHLSDDARLLAYSVNEDGFSRVAVRISSRVALCRSRVAAAAFCEKMAFSPDATQLAFDLSTATSVGDVWSWTVKAGKLTRWTTSELGGLDPARLASRSWCASNRSTGPVGARVLYRPVGVGPRRAHSRDHGYYGGPEAQTRPRGISARSISRQCSGYGHPA